MHGTGRKPGSDAGGRVVSDEPVAWLFRNPDGSTRWILDDPERVRLWATAHEGEVVPLYEQDNCKDEPPQA